jgi:hypothetical protein
MQPDDLDMLRARITAGEHLTPDDWQRLMDYSPLAHQIADLTIEYIAARINRMLTQQRAA